MSMFKKVLTVAGFGLATCMMAGGQADALSTDSANLDVTVAVTQTCAFGADQTLDFGSYTTGGGAVFGSATFSLDCTAGALVDVTLDDGGNAAALGTTTPANPDRAMANGASLLEYELCQDNTCTQVWGADPTNTVQYLGTGPAGTLTVFGEIFGNQPVVSGTYQDQVSITVTF
jgi:spore coat protein U-like protein